MRGTNPLSLPRQRLMVTVTRQDIQSVYGNKEPTIDEAQQEALANVAESITDNVFGGKTGKTSEIEGDETHFAWYVGAHLWEQAEGGETSSESQTGGSVSFGHKQSQLEEWLSETRYGRTALLIKGSGTSSTGIIRADR